VKHRHAQHAESSVGVVLPDQRQAIDGDGALTADLSENGFQRGKRAVAPVRREFAGQSCEHGSPRTGKDSPSGRDYRSGSG
jgi:hypothetical protein